MTNILYWKKIHLITNIFLSVFLLLEIYRFVISISSEMFGTDVFMLLLSVSALFLHFLYMKNLNALVEKDAIAIEILKKSELGLYFSFAFYLLLIVEVVTLFIIYFLNNSNNLTMFVFNSIKAITIIVLVGSVLKSVRIRKQIIPKYSNKKSSGFFGTWKPAVVLILLGILKMGLTGSSDKLGLGIIIFGLVLLIIALSKKLKR